MTHGFPLIAGTKPSRESCLEFSECLLEGQFSHPLQPGQLCLRSKGVYTLAEMAECKRMMSLYFSPHKGWAGQPSLPPSSMGLMWGHPTQSLSPSTPKHGVQVGTPNPAPLSLHTQAWGTGQPSLPPSTPKQHRVQVGDTQPSPSLLPPPSRWGTPVGVFAGSCPLYLARITFLLYM